MIIEYSCAGEVELSCDSRVYSCVGGVKSSMVSWVVMVEYGGDESSCDGGVELGGVVMVEFTCDYYN